MKKKNGFTLIELLAVIVILAVIALIAVPQILKILNKARKSAAEDTTYGIVKAAENYVTNFMLENNGTMPSESLEFICDGSSCNLSTTLTGYNLTGLDKLDFKGTKPTDGTITISNNGVNIVANNLQINGYSCNYTNGNATCTSGSSSENNPTPSLTGPTSETPTGDGYTGVKTIVYLDPTDLTKYCDASNANSETGTKTGCMKWYAYNDDGTNYTMILDHNTTATIDNWDNRNTQLSIDITGWNSNLNPRLITANEINDITGNVGFDLTNIGSYYLDTKTTTSSNDIPNNYGWLFDRTSSSCISYGCLNDAIGTVTYGYWADTLASSSRAWYIDSVGALFSNFLNNEHLGIRPVITVPKNKIS